MASGQDIKGSESYGPNREPGYSEDYFAPNEGIPEGSTWEDIKAAKKQKEWWDQNKGLVVLFILGLIVVAVILSERLK